MRANSEAIGGPRSSVPSKEASPKSPALKVKKYVCARGRIGEKLPAEEDATKVMI
jgi:hypothetical protein